MRGRIRSARAHAFDPEHLDHFKTFDAVQEVARGISEANSVACVGPHTVGEFA